MFNIPVPQILAGHSSMILACAFSPTERLILSASADRTLRLWDAERKCRQTFTGHAAEVTACAFSSDGIAILSGSNDRTVMLWNLEGKCTQTIVGHAAEITACAFSPRDRTILSASKDGTVRIWSRNGYLVKTFEHTDSVSTCCFRLDGQTFLSGGDDNDLTLWNIDGSKHYVFKGHTASVRHCVFNSNGTMALSASADHTLRLWDMKTGNCISVLRGHTDIVNICAFHPNDQIILSGSNDKTLKFWNTTGECLATIEEHSPITACVFSRKGQAFLSVSSDNILKLWLLDNDAVRYVSPTTAIAGPEALMPSRSFSAAGLVNIELVTTLRAQAPTITAIAIGGIDDDEIIVSSSPDDLRVWGKGGRGWMCKQTLIGHTAPITTCAVSRDGKFIVSGSEDRTVRVWEKEKRTWSCTHVITGHADAITTCAILVTREVTLIVSGSKDRTVRMWERNIKGWASAAKFSDHLDAVTACAVSGNAESIVVASASVDGTVRLWQRKGRWTKLDVLRGHTAPVTCCAFSFKGSYLISGSLDTTLRLWDKKQNWKCANTLQGHTAGVLSCVFNPSGQLLLSSAQDGTVRIWNKEKHWTSTLALAEQAYCIQRCAFGRDSYNMQLFITSSANATISVWNGDTLKTFHNAPLVIPGLQTIQAGEVNYTKTEATMLGDGSFGEVYHGIWRGIKVAIKELKSARPDDDEIQSFNQEVTMLSRLRHPHVVLLYGASTSLPRCMILEFLPRAMDEEILNDKWLLPDRMLAGQDTAHGLQHIHNQDILHCDLKSANVLLDTQWRAKICDFGLATSIRETRDTAAGTIGWVAPEILSEYGPHYSTASDVYALGMLLWQLIARENPFGVTDDNIIIDKVRRGQRPNIPQDAPELLKKVITGCWRELPSGRYRASRSTRLTLDEVLTLLAELRLTLPAIVCVPY